MASRYNIDKSEIFDVHGTGKKKSNAAVKLAVGETQIVNDMRKFLIRNGVKLDSFQQQNNNNTERSKTVVLIKNLPNNTSENELRDMFTKAKVNEAGTLYMYFSLHGGISNIPGQLIRQPINY